MTWDLSAIYKNEEELFSVLDDLNEKSLSFKSLYEGNLDKIKDFSAVLKSYESILEELSLAGSYAYLVFAADTKKGAFYAKCEEITNKIAQNLVFFELEFCDLDENISSEYINKSKGYEYYLKELLRGKKHHLSKSEEELLIRLAPSDKFARLFDETLSHMSFKLDDELLNEEQILAKFHNPNRLIRKKAAKSLSKGLEKQANLLTYIFNMIKNYHKISTELRKYDSPMQARNMSNKITQESVDALIQTAENSFNLVEEFYQLKQKILGFKDLKEYDRYAPLILKGKEKKYSFNESKKIVLAAFKNFSPVFGDIAKEAFDQRWIDAPAREHKRGGAFSASLAKRAHPYVLLNHQDSRRDLFTMAHELGHAVHQKLSYSVEFLNQDTPLTTAETASVFAEMLVFDYLKDFLSKEEKISLYASKLEDIFATLYRQINFTTFEQALHSHEGEFTKEELCDLWMKESKKMFGKGLSLSKNYAHSWSYISHFIHSPFYCYAYSYAQLLVLALYALYKKNSDEKSRQDFLEKYTSFLSSGGSKSPKELISVFGFDIDNKDFWLLGLGEVKKILKEFKDLVNAK